MGMDPAQLGELIELLVVVVVVPLVAVLTACLRRWAGLPSDTVAETRERPLRPEEAFREPPDEDGRHADDEPTPHP